MKKTYLIIAATALVALSACTKNEVRSISDEPSQITWQTVIGPKSTKALVDGNAFDQKYKFKTYAFYNANGTTWPGQNPEEKASLYIDNAEVEYDATGDETFAANSWHADQVYYWPKGGSLTFISYTLADNDANGNAKYPDGVTCTPDDGLKVAGYNVNTNKNLDFMVADIKSGQTANTTKEAGAATGVPTVFRHTLTQIVKFNVKTDQDYKGDALAKGSKVVTVKSIKIVNAFSKGNYQMTNNASKRTEKWSNLSESRNYEYKTSDGNPTEVTTTGVDLTNEQKAFMPQPFDAPTYTFTGQTEAEKALEKKTQAYIDAVKAVPHIEFEYTIDTYTNATAHSIDNVTEYVALSDINTEGWGINKKITYNITISLAGAQNELIIYWDPKVEKWDDTNSSYDYTI